VVEADKWETQKQLNVSGALEEYQADATPEKAMAAHQTLVNFHQHSQAAECRREMAEKFPQNAKMQAYLGQSLSERGAVEEASPFFHRALELRPDLPEARVGVAREHIRAGKLEEARALLDFLEKPGAAQLYSLGPLETLAIAYQGAGKREEALHLFKVILEALPAVGEISDFRNRVRQCEKMLGHKESILPKMKFSWKRFFGMSENRQRQPGSVRITWRGLAMVGAVIALIVGGIFLHGIYERHHRELYIVNALAAPATVEVRDVGMVKVAAGHGREKLELAEGKYHVTITGPVHEELDIEVKTPEYSTKPVWLLNVGGAALILQQNVTYQAHNAPPSKITPHFGQEFEFIDSVTHPFQVLPETVKMESHEHSRVLTNLEYSKVEPDQLLGWLEMEKRNPEAARLAEWRIKTHPDDAMALRAFAQLAPAKHVEEVLKAGLGRRPVEMQWHRTYQNLHRTTDWFQWQAVIYDGMLKAEPNNSALLYLRGRMATKPGEGTQWFERARAADANNPYPYYAIGFDHLAVGDWTGAHSLFARAVELKPDGPGFGEALYSSRLALEDYDALEKEIRAFTAKQPLDFNARMKLVHVLLAAGKGADAEKVVTTAEQQARQKNDPEFTSAVQALRGQYLYAKGDFAQLAQLGQRDRSEYGRNFLFMALLEQGKVAEALKVRSFEKAVPDDIYMILSVSLAWSAVQDEQQAEVWRQKAAKLLAASSPDGGRAAALLDKGAAVTKEATDTVVLDCKPKAIFLAALGAAHPEHRDELFAASRKLNVERDYPYHLVSKVAGDARQ